MKLPRRSGVLVLGVVTAGVTVLLSWGLLQDPAGPWQSLPDGSRARVVGVTYGTRHQVEEGRIWQRLLYPLSPRGTPLRIVGTGGAGGATNLISVPGIFGGWRDEWELPSPELIAWVRYRSTSKQWHMPYFDARDEHGCLFTGDSQWLHSMPLGEGLAAVRFKAFPRRGSNLRLVARASYHQSLRSEALSVQTPAFGALPTWLPERLPQTRLQDDLEFTLRGWAFGRANPIVRFAVRRDGKPTLDWEPVTVIASDATGNSVITKREREPQPDPTRILFLGLCFREPA